MYEECTKIVLEIWSQFRGTDVQWKILLMTEEDQRACIAHLGFVLHKRLQHDPPKPGVDRWSIVSDVPASYLLREIESFLGSQDLFISVVEQRAEARRFFKMIQLETGLIVERGTNEDGEALYGFIHRTFQEYFAAMDVYERYQREENTSILGDFLQTNLYDPHWHEVILLLLGKLKRKPVTSQLLQILEGKIENRQNNFKEMLRNDLFFVSYCLAEDISVEKQLAVQVVQDLSQLIAGSPFQSQCSEALGTLISLKSTRRYGELAHHALLTLLTQVSIDALTKMQVAEAIYYSSSTNSQEELQARQTLVEMASSPAIPFKSANMVLGRLYFSCAGDVDKRQGTEFMLYQLIERPTTTFDEALTFFAGMLYAEEDESEESPLAIQMLLELAEHPHISLELLGEIAQTIYSLQDSKYYHFSSSKRNEEYFQILRTLRKRLLQTPLSFEESLLINEAFCKSTHLGSDEHRQALARLSQLSQMADITLEQRVQAVRTYIDSSSLSSTERESSLQGLVVLFEHPNLTVEQILHLAQAIYRYSMKERGPNAIEMVFDPRVMQTLFKITKRPDISFGQLVSIIQFLYQDENPPIFFEWEYSISAAEGRGGGYEKYNERALARQIMSQLLENPNLTDSQRLQLMKIPLKTGFPNVADLAHSIRTIMSIFNDDAAREYFKEHLPQIEEFFLATRHPIDTSEVPILVELIGQELLPVEFRDAMFKMLRQLFPLYWKVSNARTYNFSEEEE